MTFAELQRGVFDDLQYQPAPRPGVQDRVRRYLNEGLDRVLRRPRLKSLRFATYPLATEAGQSFYGVAMQLDRIDYIIDLTNGRRLPFKTRDWYRSLDPGSRVAGTPSVWIPEGMGPMMRYPQPSADGSVYLWASAGPPDTTQLVEMFATFYHGNLYNNYATLTGTTPVKLGAASGAQGMPPGTQITSLTVNATTYSYVMFQDDPNKSFQSGQVAIINAGEFQSRHLGIRLYPTPTATLHYEVEGLRTIPKMTNDFDEPPFPDAFHEMLQCYCRGRFYRKDGRLQQSATEMAEFERFAVELTAYVEFPDAYRPVAGKLSSQVTRWSDLGPNYPADRTNFGD